MSSVTSQKPTWKLDSQNLTKAYKVLKLQHPVTYRLRSQFWYGSYFTPLHTVAVNPTQDETEASHTIWHELGHAMQCERDCNGDYATWWSNTQPSYGDLFDTRPSYDSDEYDDWYNEYMQVPVEAEAEEIADRYHKRYKLTQPTRRFTVL